MTFSIAEAAYAAPPVQLSATQQTVQCPISSGQARCPVAPVPPWDWAVACHNDLDGDGKPKDAGDPRRAGGCLELHAQGRFGPPSFEAARVAVTAPVTLDLRFGR